MRGQGAREYCECDCCAVAEAVAEAEGEAASQQREVVSLQLLARKQQRGETRADLVVLLGGRGALRHVSLARVRVIVKRGMPIGKVAVNWDVEAPKIIGCSPCLPRLRTM